MANRDNPQTPGPKPFGNKPPEGTAAANPPTQPTPTPSSTEHPPTPPPGAAPKDPRQTPGQPAAPDIPPGQSTAQGGARQQSPQEIAKDKGGLKTLKEGETYVVREGSATAWWWKRKHDKLPEVTIEGRVDKILGVPAGELRNHPLVDALRDRITALPAQHPVAKDWNDLYVGTVQGRRELVHPHEVEERKQ